MPFNTDNQKISNWKNFINNIDKEKEDLKKIKKSFTKNDGEIGVRQQKFKINRLTNNLTSYSKKQIEDKLKAIEDNDKKE